ncbi:hypothetical protein A9Q84_00040 [Halobacteriovorax marinus]|uniref:Uncharacterized protein n=1 Tax=Halobacteriovorax marinus TaxID=97084 RepID=A0A1Y5FDD2_9BACT|nr:hypothetical protein A9Q84_00040 [Halobacteriovorax marinus]
MELVDNFIKNFKANHSTRDTGLEVNSSELFWTPVEFVKTSFPEKKIESLKWLRQFAYYQLSLQQLEENRNVPYGMMAREIFDYFYNQFVVKQNQGHETPNHFFFSSAAEFVNLVKGKPLGTKVSTDQRTQALEMLLNMESCAIRFKKPVGEDEVRTNNNLFIRSYSGPAYAKLKETPGRVTNGEIEIELDFDTFNELSHSKRVPTRSYLVDLAGSNVTARDLVIFIASQCYSLHKRSTDYIDYCYSDLRQILGKDTGILKENFNKDLKRAVKLLTKRYEDLHQEDFFPAELISEGRGKIKLRIYRPRVIKNILCA